MLTVKCYRFLAGEPATPLRLHQNKGYGFQDYGKPWFFHGSSSLSATLKDFTGLNDTALVDLHGCWVICFYSF